ncbi:MAG: thioredoxin family protein [Tenericutes bacterium]|jgi:glutaredoxin-like protein|nr:thioredoxin family protein [Mycoplasmatota bacterium]
MANLLNEEVSKQIKEALSPMQNEITMVLFTKESGCNTCEETEQLLTEVKALNDKISVEVKDIDKDKEDVEKYHITDVPTFVILDDNKKYKGVKFQGIPAGHEINSFLSAMVFMSGLDLGLDQKIVERLSKITKPIDIKVFVTLSCPHCPGAVATAHSLAMLNENIEASMIEAQTFQQLSVKHNVSGVPKIIINDEFELVGNHPIDAFLTELEKI